MLDHFIACADQASYIQLYIDAPIGMALKRNKQRCKAERVAEHVIERMSAVLERPSQLHAAWEESTVVLDASGPFTNAMACVLYSATAITITMGVQSACFQSYFALCM
jgi:predicted kinase